MSELRALTIRQPWCEPVADGIKTTENRAQGFPKAYRGLVLIHAGKGWSARGQRDPRVRAAYGAEHRVAPAIFEAMPRGAGLAVADLVDVHPAAGCCAPWGEETYPPANPEGRPPGVVTHLTFERPVRIEPIPARGALGLWRPDPDLVLEVAHRLADLVTWDAGDLRPLVERGDVAQLWALIVDDRSSEALTP